MERLDSLLQKIEDPPDILTHEKAIPSIKANYPGCRIIEYPFKSSFKKSLTAKMVKKGKVEKNYDEVVVLTSNVEGGGHHNVVDAAFVFGARVKIYNVNGDFLDISPGLANRERLRRILLFPAVISGTIFLSILGGVILFSGFAANFFGRKWGPETNVG